MIMAGIMVAGMETIEVTRASGGTADGQGGAIVSITLIGPEKRNAINGGDVGRAARHVPGDRRAPSDRCVVITGAGGAFCSGADLSGERTGYGAAPPAPGHAPRQRRGAGPARACRSPPSPRSTGVAAGAGANLAFGCDLIVASDEARFSEIFARRGCPSTSAARGCCPASWAAPGQGAGLLRRHHLGQGGGGDRPRQPAGAGGRHRPLRRRLGPAAGGRPAHRDRARPSRCSTAPSSRPSSSRSTTRRGPRP